MPLKRYPRRKERTRLELAMTAWDKKALMFKRQQEAKARAAKAREEKEQFEAEESQRREQVFLNPKTLKSLKL
mgnify:CR=1 FL=1